MMTDKINIKVDELDIIVQVYDVVLPEDSDKMSFSFDYENEDLKEHNLTEEELGEYVGNTLLRMVTEWVESQRE